MLELVLTTKRCKDIIDLLVQKRSWSLARVAKVLGKSTEYVDRILAGHQSFQVVDVELLAKAVRLRPAILIFNSIQTEELTAADRGFHAMVMEDVKRHQEFQKVMSRKPAKKRRVRSTAA